MKNEIQAVEEKTSHSMQVLVAVDKVKTRVEQTCSALKEADNWSSLAAAIEDIFRLLLCYWEYYLFNFGYYDSDLFIKYENIFRIVNNCTKSKIWIDSYNWFFKFDIIYTTLFVSLLNNILGKIR